MNPFLLLQRGVYRNELGSRHSGGSLHGTVHAEMSPVPTDANVLCLSGKTVGPFLTRHPAKIWRETGPSKEDHITEGLTISSKQNVGGDAMGKK
jgi:hypothetical protein